MLIKERIHHSLDISKSMIYYWHNFNDLWNLKSTLTSNFWLYRQKFNDAYSIFKNNAVQCFEYRRDIDELKILYYVYFNL